MTTDIEAFIGQEGRDKAIQEVRKQIDAEGVEYIYYQFVSVTGRIMGKGIPAAHWERIAQTRASSSSTARRRTCSSTATATTSATGPRRASWSGIPEAETFCSPAVGPEDRAGVLHAVPRPGGGGRRRRAS